MRRFITTIALLLILAAWIGAAVLCDFGTNLRDRYQQALRDNQTAADQEYATRQHIEWLESQRDEAQATLDDHVQYMFENRWPDGHRVYNPWPIGEPAPNPSCTYCQNMLNGIQCTQEEIEQASLDWSHWDWMIDYTGIEAQILWSDMEAHAATCEECES